MALGDKAASVYAKKSTTGKFNAHIAKYSEEQVKAIRDMNIDFLYYFGYVKHPSEENPTGFFDFESHSKENLDKYYGFKKDNKDIVAKLAKDGGWKGPSYRIMEDKELYPNLPMFDLGKV